MHECLPASIRSTCRSTAEALKQHPVLQLAHTAGIVMVGSSSVPPLYPFVCVCFTVVLQAQLALMEVQWPEGLYEDTSHHQQQPEKHTGLRVRSKRGSKCEWPGSGCMWEGSSSSRRSARHTLGPAGCCSRNDFSVTHAACESLGGCLCGRGLRQCWHHLVLWTSSLLVCPARMCFIAVLSQQERSRGSLLPSGPSGWLRKSKGNLKQSGGGAMHMQTHSHQLGWLCWFLSPCLCCWTAYTLWSAGPACVVRAASPLINCEWLFVADVVCFAAASNVSNISVASGGPPSPTASDNLDKQPTSPIGEFLDPCYHPCRSSLCCAVVQQAVNKATTLTPPPPNIREAVRDLACSACACFY